VDREFEGDYSDARPGEFRSRAARILNASVPLFRAGGIPVRLHWSFFVFVLIFSGWTARTGAGTVSTSGLLLWGLVLAALLFFVLVLPHELGHAWAAILKGGSCEKITLTPLGGLAHVEGALAGPGTEAEVTIAGPGVNLLILAVSMVFVSIYGLPARWSPPFTLPAALGFVFWANVVMVIFNLAPAFPLDGGRLLRAFLSWRRGAKRGTRLACRVGQVAGVAFIVWGIYSIRSSGPFGWIVASIGIFNILNCSATIRMVEMGLPVYEDYLPEHGYAPERPKETREERKAREAADLERRLNGLLDKVASQGMKSLSLGERLFLRRASRHFRGRPPPDA